MFTFDTQGQENKLLDWSSSQLQNTNIRAKQYKFAQ
jgi:hypothetical protein